MLYAGEMIKVLSLSDLEAIGRLNRHWSQNENPFDVGHLFYDSPIDWEYTIYYGHVHSSGIIVKRN